MLKKMRAVPEVGGFSHIYLYVLGGICSNGHTREVIDLTRFEVFCIFEVENGFQGRSANHKRQIQAGKK
jgi:hypothetical protein